MANSRPSDRTPTRAERIIQIRASLPHDCPLRVHSNGQWSKKIGGRRVLFGSILEVDLDEAVRRYRIYVGEIAADRTPAPVAAAAIRVHHVLTDYSDSQFERAAAGEIAPKTADRIRPFLELAGAELGANRRVSSLTAADFRRLRLALLRAYDSPATVRGAIQATKAAFNHAVDEAGTLEQLPPWGKAFRPPARRDVRRHRRDTATDSGQLFLDRHEIRQLVDAANPMLRAAILLGINGALGGQECADLRRDEVNLSEGLIITVRDKTLVDRVVWLWPETTDAIRAWIEHARSIPRTAEARDLLFCTRNGRPAARRVSIRKTPKRPAPGDPQGSGDGSDAPKPFTAASSAISQAFERLLDPKKTGLKRRRIGFYTLRHTFAAIAAGAGDPRTVKIVMGHATDFDITESYVDEGFIDSVRHVCTHVHEWYLGERPTPRRLSSFRRGRASD